MFNKEQQNEEPLQERIVSISRVAKVVKGGRRFSFSALVAVGDGNGQVGFGVGKAGEIPDAVRKASDQAKKTMKQVYYSSNGTIPFNVIGKYGSAKIVMNPAKKGKGIIAGGAVRVLVELSGIKDIVCKVHGTKNAHNVVRATMNGLLQLVGAEEYASARGKTVEEAIQTRKTC